MESQKLRFPSGRPHCLREPLHLRAAIISIKRNRNHFHDNPEDTDINNGLCFSYDNKFNIAIIFYFYVNVLEGNEVYMK